MTLEERAVVYSRMIFKAADERKVAKERVKIEYAENGGRDYAKITFDAIDANTDLTFWIEPSAIEQQPGHLEKTLDDIIGLLADRLIRDARNSKCLIQ